MGVPQSWLFYGGVAAFLLIVSAIIGGAVEMAARAIGSGLNDLHDEEPRR